MNPAATMKRLGLIVTPASDTRASGTTTVSQETVPGATLTTTSLPCLNNSHNSDITQLPLYGHAFPKPRPKLTARQRKTIFTFLINTVKFVGDTGIERMGFLTLTFKYKVYSSRKAARFFDKLNRRVLKYFGRWVRVIEQHKDGAWHYHLLVEMPCDILTGFDFATYKAAQGEYERSGPSAEYHRLLNVATSEGHPLPPIWKKLRKRLKNYSFKHFELTPIRTNAEAISQYMANGIIEGYASKTPGRPRIRLHATSKKINRRVRGDFSWVSSGARLSRKQYALLGEGFGCNGMEELSERAGKRWAYHLKDEIRALVPLRLTDQQYIKQCENLRGKGFLNRISTHNYPVFEVMIPTTNDGDTSTWPVYDRNSWNESVFSRIISKCPQLGEYHESGATPPSCKEREGK
jgi:hypothetical protein